MVSVFSCDGWGWKYPLHKLLSLLLAVSVAVLLLAACTTPGMSWGKGGAGGRKAYVDWQLTQDGSQVDTCGDGWGYSLWQRKCVKVLFPWQDRLAFRTVGDAFISGADFSVLEIREGVYQENEIGLDSDGVVVLVSDLTIKNYKQEAVTIQNDYATRVTFVLHHEAGNLHFHDLTLQGTKFELVRGWEPVPGYPNVWRVLYDRGLVQKLYNEGLYGWPVVCVLAQGDSNIDSCLSSITERARFYQDYLRDETGAVIGLNGYLYVYSDGDPNEEEIIVGGNYALGSSGGTGGVVELDNVTITGFSHSGVKGNYGWFIHDSFFSDLGLDEYDHHIYTQTVATEDAPVIIERNYFEGAMGCAIKLAPEPPQNPLPENYIIRHNVFNGNDSCGIFLGSRYSAIYNNTIFDSGIGIWFYNPRSTDFGVPESHGNRVFNNLLMDNATGDLQVYYFDGDLSPGPNQVWNNYLGSANPCVNCYCEYAHYGAENNFISDIWPFVSDSPESWMDFALKKDFPWIDQGVDPDLPGDDGLAPPKANATWPPLTKSQNAFGNWDLGAFVAIGRGQTPPDEEAPAETGLDPHDPERAFPRLEDAPEWTEPDLNKPHKGYVLYPNDFEATFSEMSFFWLSDPSATAYELWIEAVTPTGQEIFLEETIPAGTAHCAGNETICYYQPDLAFAPGEYLWWISGRRGDSQGDWSEGMPFAVGGGERLCYVELLSPAEAAGASPSFTWKAQEGVETYQLYVSEAYSGAEVFSRWYTPEEAGCDATRCQVSPPVSLEDGQYRWEMQSRAGEVLSPWSRSMVFTVMENPPQEIPQQVHPINTVFEQTLTFYWYEVPMASDYTLSVKNGAGEVVVERCFSAEEANCNWQCSATLEETFSAGAYSWQVRANNAAGMGTWSQPLYFQVELPPNSPPGVPEPQAPMDITLPPGPVSFSWTAVEAVTEYYVWVEDTDRTVWVDQMVLPEDLGCAEGPLCIFTPSLQFTPGDYHWFVTARNQAGYAQWETGVPFTISGGHGVD
jgi:hypothetical protein